MAEPQVSSDLARTNLLYKPETSSLEPFSSPDSHGQASERTVDDSSYDEALPNNNVSSSVGPVDCLNDGGCVSNPTIISSRSPDTNQEQRIKISADIDFKLDKKLIVKLEAPPTFNTKLNSNIKIDNIDDNTTKIETDTIPDASNNGVIKKRRKRKNDGESTGKSTRQRGQSGRGRPPKKPAIATYHSQISGDNTSIKIRIRKAHFGVTPPPAKRSRQRKRQKKQNAGSDTDASDYETGGKRRTESSPRKDGEMGNSEADGPLEQSRWGQDLPKNFLNKVFEYLCYEQGALPLLVKLCKICKLWRSVAISPNLWENVDLSRCVKERSKTDIKLQWLIQNRLNSCKDLNLSDWKIQNIHLILEQLCTNCPELQGLNLSGWSGLTAENLKYLTTECSKLERLDLSAVNVTNQGTKSALNAGPLVSLAQTVGSRLTHLCLAHNKLVGISQILNGISAHCPNLQLLDISNIKTHAYNSSLLHVEKLQAGCPKLRVLRVTNSQISLSPTSLTEQMASPGFPELEELSLAGIEDDQTTSKFIDDNGIERILKSSHKLRLLDVRGCTKITDSGLVKVPAWDLEHLFLSACYVTRLNHSGLELIIQKWSHSLVEVDLAWSSATAPLDAAVMTLAEKGSESPLRILDLCGSSVSVESVKAVLLSCPHIQSINLQSCRALPRGIKRLYEGPAVSELSASLQGKSLKPNEADEAPDSVESQQTPDHTPVEASPLQRTPENFGIDN